MVFTERKIRKKGEEGLSMGLHQNNLHDCVLVRSQLVNTINILKKTPLRRQYLWVSTELASVPVYL